ncbi:hypothetical protein VULLAG_LOCUS19123 [Vulpes lagopus]
MSRCSWTTSGQHRNLEKHMECSPSAEAALHPGDKPHWVM